MMRKAVANTGDPGNSFPWLWISSAILLGLNTAWIYSTRVVLPNADVRMSLEAAIVAGVAESPWQYRFFIPHIAHELGLVLESTGLSPIQIHQLTHLLLDGLAASSILFLSSLLSGFLRFSNILTLQLVVYSGLNVSLYDHAYAPWSMFEIALWVLALFVIKKNRPWLLVLILPTMGLVRETAVLLSVCLVLLLAFGGRGLEQRFKKASPGIAALALTGLVQVGIRVSLGPRADDISLIEVLGINLSSTGLRQVVFNVLLMFGLPLLIFVLRRSRARQQFSWEKRVLISMTPYLLAVIGGAIWYEVRLFGVLLPVIAIFAMKLVTYAEETESAIQKTG